MAELDLIDIWNKDKASLQKAELDIDQAIGKKSTSVLSKIRFILKIEFWLNNAITPACAVVYFNTFGKFWGIFTGLIFLIYFTYYLFLIRSINKFDYSNNVRESLTQIYKYLKFYVLHYKVVIWLSFLVLPLSAFGYGIYIGYTGDQPISIFEEVPKLEVDESFIFWFLAIFFGSLIALAVLFHYLVGLLYEKKIKQLKVMINDLG